MQLPVDVSDGLRKQEAETGIILWEANTDSVEEDTSYEFKGVTIQVYKHEKHLPMSKEGAGVIQIQDIVVRTIHGFELQHLGVSKHFVCISQWASWHHP